jgi:hypothetical protein
MRSLNGYANKNGYAIKRARLPDDKVRNDVKHDVPVLDKAMQQKTRPR